MIRLLLSVVLTLVALTALLPVLQKLGERDQPPASAPTGVPTAEVPPATAEPSPPREHTTTAKGFLYIWRDSNGVHIESVPPPDGVHAERLPFERRIVIEPPAEAEQSSAVAEESAPGAGLNPMTVYTPEGFEELLERIDRTADQLREREELLESLREEL